MTEQTPPGPSPASVATTGTSVLAGGAWNTVALVLPQLYTLLVSVAVARFLGPEDMGRQSFIAFAQVSLFMLLANGMPGALNRYTGDLLGRNRPDAVHRLVRWTVRAQAASAVVALGGLGLIGLTRSELRSAWILAGVACAAGVLHAVPGALLVGLQRWREASIVGLTTGAFGVAGTIAVLAADWGIAGVFGVEAVVGVVNALATGVLARRALASVDVPNPDGPVPADLPGGVARYAAVQTAQTFIFFVVWSRSEFFFLERWSGDQELAMYSVAFAATTALGRLPQGVSGVLLPAVATLHGAREAVRIRRAFERSVRLVLAFSLPLTAGALALGPTAIEVVYGGEYARAGRILLILLAVFPLLPLFHLAASVLQGVDRIGLVFGANLAATVVNIAADVVLIDRFGAVGAAYANVAAQATAAAVLMALATRALEADTTPAWLVVRNVAAAVLAGGAAAAMIVSLPSLAGLLAGAVAFAAVWCGAAVAFRIVDRQDAEWLSASVGRRVGPAATRVLQPFLR